MNEVQTEAQIVIVQNDVQQKFLQKQHVEMVVLNEKKSATFEQTKTEKTKKTTEEVKTTYYRYATRSCNGGSTSIKWSTSKNDSILKSEGYKLTGKKKELIVK